MLRSIDLENGILIQEKRIEKAIVTRGPLASTLILPTEDLTRTISDKVFKLKLARGNYDPLKSTERAALKPSA